MTSFIIHLYIWSYTSCLVLGPARQKGPQLAKLGTRWELWALDRYLCNEQRFLDFHFNTGVGYSLCRMVGFCEVTPNFQSSCLKRSIGTLFGESHHKILFFSGWSDLFTDQTFFKPSRSVIRWAHLKLFCLGGSNKKPRSPIWGPNSKN